MPNDMPCADEGLEEIDYSCMECGGVPDVVETIHTGDGNSLRGWEVWCYCRKCDCETFKQIKLKSE